ncbi:hypothetical protein ALC57_06876 [Trachymyrmex cornetzi]|uniref:Uncharacterized protein n=1 Tax=Trachymyrmex cornetzi TaxID=471704 RepID=A0A195E704_9HYME|nr:hypothetical protein ALC57_06876 [Trachymyrmex cornetzi]
MGSYCEPAGREIREVASLKIARTNANDFYRFWLVGIADSERERGHTNGLISQQCDLFALYSHKEPTLLCHYVTKEGVIAQQGPPVRLLLPNLSTIALKEPMIHEWPEATSNPVGNQESWRRRSESGCADRFINAYWKQVGR